MNLNFNSLNGIWEGQSISTGGQSTLWTKTILAFGNLTENEILVNGKGISVWKGENIVFKVAGAINRSSLKGTLEKEHRGRFTNTVSFEVELSTADLRLTGTYAKGDLTLIRLQDADEAFCHLLSTSWKGCSQSTKAGGAVTEWIEMSLEFKLKESNARQLFTAYDIRGKGLSLWKRERIPFTLEGGLLIVGEEDADPSLSEIWDHIPLLEERNAREVTLNSAGLKPCGKIWLNKTHTDDVYRNTIQCFGDFLNESLEMMGCYGKSESQSGSFQLQLAAPLSTDTELNLAEHAELVHHLLEPIIRQPPSQATGPLTMYERVLLTSKLNGSWEGVSCKVLGQAKTKWHHTHIEFITSTNGRTATMTGQGLSLWKTDDVGFSLSGQVDWASGFVVIEKKHFGKFNNTTVYEGIFQLANQDVTSEEEPDAFVVRVQNEIITAQNLSEDQDGSEWFARKLLRSSNVILFMTGTLGEGAFQLICKNDAWLRPENASLPLEDIVDRELAKEQAKFATQAGNDARSNKHSDDAEMKDETSDTSVEKIMRYEFFVRGMICSSKSTNLTEKQIQALSNFRVCEGISELEHKQVLQKIGLTYDGSSPASKGAENNSSLDEDNNLCKIDFVNPIDCVILPCGHFVVCKDCGSQLRHCPIDRSQIEKIQPIFFG